MQKVFTFASHGESWKRSVTSVRLENGLKTFALRSHLANCQLGKDLSVILSTAKSTVTGL